MGPDRAAAARPPAPHRPPRPEAAGQPEVPVWDLVRTVHRDPVGVPAPRELGFGSGMTAWRRLRDWQDAGVWQQLHEALDCLLAGGVRVGFLRRVPLPGNDLVRCLVAVTGSAPARDP